MTPAVSRGRRTGSAVLTVVAALGLAACSATPALVETPSVTPASPTPPTSTSTPSATSSPSLTPTVTPTQSASPTPRPDPVADPDATLEVSPIDFSGNTLIVARFSDPEKGAQVILQQKSGKKWQDVATGGQDGKGRAEFLVPGGAGAYRAISLGAEALATPAGDAKSQWRRVLSTDFDGSKLPKPWSHADTGSYLTGGRQCSASYPSNVKLKDGKLVLSVTEETKASRKKAADRAGCKHDRYLRNATVYTGAAGFTMRTGTVAARIKFPPGQGQHGSVFLMSPSMTTEIDIVESYGYGSGLTNVVHRQGKRYPATAEEAYVHAGVVKDRSWWDEYHVFSVEWDAKDVTFRIDGVVTRRLSRPNLKDEFMLYLSMLASDWEQRRFEDPVRNAEGVTLPKLPATMYVDWVRGWEPA